MNVFLTAYCALCLAASTQCLRPFFRPPLTSNYPRPTADAGEPLFLTPLIKAGNISEARNRSAVSLLPKIEGNAGFLTVDLKFNSNLFFWFCKKAGSNWTAAPVILWLGDRLGESALFALFGENGPYRIWNSTLKPRGNRMTMRFNGLWMDHPVGTGFSHTLKGGYVSTLEEVGQHVYEALTQFFILFPELAKNELYLAGNGYAAKHVAAVGRTIHRRNQESNNGQIPLKGMLIDSGWLDPPNMIDLQYWYETGLIDRKQKGKIEMTQKQVEMSVRDQQWLNATAGLGKMHDELTGAMNFSFPDGCTREDYDSKHINEYLANNEVRKSIHVGQCCFNDSSGLVYEYLEAEIMKSVKPWIEELLEHYRMCFISHQFSKLFGYSSLADFMLDLQWSGKDEYNKKDRHVWSVDGHVAGYFKVAGNLFDVLVRNTGHGMPVDQSRLALNLLVRFVDGIMK